MTTVLHRKQADKNFSSTEGHPGMNKLRHPIAMLIVGTAYGFFSGMSDPSVFGVRGALFGLFLSLTVLWIRKTGWGWNKLIPGIVLGLLLIFLMPYFPAAESCIILVVNCAIFIPVYALCYLRPKFLHTLLTIIPAGALSTLIRVLPMKNLIERELYTPLQLYLNVFIQGALPFLALWLIAMWLSDPRFNKVHPDKPQPGK